MLQISFFGSKRPILRHKNGCRPINTHVSSYEFDSKKKLTAALKLCFLRSVGRSSFTQAKKSPQMLPSGGPGWQLMLPGACYRWAMGLTWRVSEPVNSWRGRPILYSGSLIISFSWAIQPTVRASANTAVNSGTGMPMAFCTMPE